jgi:hypothetical protein
LWGLRKAGKKTKNRKDQERMPFTVISLMELDLNSDDDPFQYSGSGDCLPLTFGEPVAIRGVARQWGRRHKNAVAQKRVKAF